MRKWKVIGFKKVQYKSKRTGNEVKGTELYAVSDPISPDVIGVEGKAFWLGQHVTYAPTVDDHIHVCYDERGNVDEVFPVNA